ncbi:hypothetical protein M3650_05525 [Paenibacillus sp. MER TA 81-3]|uniref:hypothetical protein n=1 Tax=Paenibacillus sp. MER TA 81-3 TaxID=2939573 RepID=UPI00203EA36F|nr:hypothetical protein [Paenibacillus sp. MER TA 81-3]MCM3338108.1 hypothetical protein [Paenibacillus sp. MER TA 81-3]
MPYEAKTDWKYDDTVTEKDLNRIEQGLKDAHVAEHEALTLSPGVQLVEVENDTPFNFGSVKGRTLNNLLGYAGACENANLWKTNSIIIEKYDAEKVQGDSCLKVALDSNFDSGNAFLFVENTTSGKSYVLIGYVKNGASYGVVRLEALEYNGENSIQFHVTPDVVNGDRLKPVHTAFTLSTTATRFAVHLAISSTSPNSYGLFDAIRVYEIPTSEVARINSMSSEDVTKEFPYLDAMTNVRNPYAIVTGANFCPLFYDWRKSGGGAGEIEAPYVQRVPNHDGKRLNSNVSIPTIQGAIYTYSIKREGGGDIGLDFLNAAGEVIQSSDYVNAGIITAKAPSGAVKTRVWTSVPERAGTYIFRNPMLTIGTEPKPFVPQQRSIWAAECNLAANPVDGSNPDTLFMGDDGLPYVLEKWKKVTLDGALNWSIGDATPQGGKQVKVTGLVIEAVPASGHVSKYDGKYIPAGTTGDTPDLQAVSVNGNFYISISNIDSGWGPDYTPDADEIKAYFLGWKMYDTSGADPTAIGTYNRTDGLHKGWTPLQSYDGNIYKGGYKGSGTPNTIPSTANTTYYSKSRTWQPYRLQYLKTKPTIEPVKNYETGATLCKGSNMVEVGSGIVLREKTTPVTNYINAINASGGRLKYKTTRLLDVYRNQARDFGWTFKDNIWNGEYYQYAENPIPGLIDAVYRVTYTMLDPTIAAPISSSLATNLRGTVSDLVQHTGDMERRLSVVENQKANAVEDTGWILVTPLNGWKQYASTPCYFRLKGKKLLFKGILQDGTATKETIVFQIPVTLSGSPAYRPLVATWSGSTTVSQIMYISNTGAVKIVNKDAQYFIGFDGVELEGDWTVNK